MIITTARYNNRILLHRYLLQCQNHTLSHLSCLLSSRQQQQQQLRNRGSLLKKSKSDDSSNTTCSSPSTSSMSSSQRDSILGDKDFLNMITQPIKSSQFNDNLHAEKLQRFDLRQSGRDEQSFKVYVSNLIMSGKVEEGMHQVLTQYPTTSTISQQSSVNNKNEDVTMKMKSPSFEMYEFLVATLAKVNRIDLVLKIYDQVVLNSSTGNKPTLGFLKQMLKFCLKVNNTTYFDHVVQLMKDLGIAFDHDCYVLMMKYYVRSRNPAKVMAIFKEMDAVGIMPGDEVYSLLIRLYFRNNQEEKGWQLFDQYKRNHPYPSPFVSRVVVHHVAVHLNDMKRAEAMIGQLPNGILSVDHYMSLVFGYLQNRLYDEALSAIQSMKKRNIAPTLTLYAPLLRQCAQRGDMDELDRMLNMLVEEQTLHPDDMWISLYKINCHVVLGQLDRARKIYDQLLARDIFPSLSITTLMIRAYLKSKQSDMAQEVFDEYKTRTDKVHPHVYTEFIQHELNNNNMEAALRIFEQIKLEGLPLTSKSYRLLISHLAKTGNITDAFHLLGDMQKQGVNPDYATLLSVMSHLCYANYLEEGRSLFEAISTKYGHFRNADAYEIIIGAHMKSGDIKTAHEYYDRMIAAKVQPDISLYSTMIANYSLMGKPDDANAIYHQVLLNNNVKPTERIYNNLIKLNVVKKKTEEAVNYLRQMTEEHNLTPFPHMIYGIFVNFVKKNQLEKAERMLEALNSSELYVAGPVMHQRLMMAYNKKGDLKKVEKEQAKINELVEKYQERFGWTPSKEGQQKQVQNLVPRVTTMAFIPKEDASIRRHLFHLDKLDYVQDTFGFDLHESPASTQQVSETTTTSAEASSISDHLLKLDGDDNGYIPSDDNDPTTSQQT